MTKTWPSAPAGQLAVDQRGDVVFRRWDETLTTDLTDMIECSACHFCPPIAPTRVEPALDRERDALARAQSMPTVARHGVIAHRHRLGIVDGPPSGEMIVMSSDRNW